MSITRTTTLETGTVRLTVPFPRRDASAGWVDAVDNPSKRLHLLEPAQRAPNQFATYNTLYEVKSGLRWGKHKSTVPFFRHPIRQQGCFESGLDLLEMPLETFYMIAALLSPRDLLKLSRSSKSVRAKLMTRNARWVWREVIERQGHPECPEDMSEPSYLSFLYDEECMSCDAPYPSVDFRQAFMRLRLCDDCAEINLRPKDDMIEELEERCRNTPRDVKLLSDILPGYEAADFHEQSLRDLVGYDEDSLVFESEVEVLIDAFYVAKSKGVDPFHKFLRGRRRAVKERKEGALLLVQTAQHILRSQLRLKDLQIPRLDARTLFGPMKARLDRAAQLPFRDASQTTKDEDDLDSNSDSDVSS